MSLVESLSKPPEKPRPRTRVGQLLEELVPSERDALLAALADYQWTPGDIVRTLRKEGIYVSVEAVRHYREVVL